ncbi:MAG: MerR family transcriptional regulator [Candidatus Aminicenantes bacterium]|nr:MerR family transcriptional regulator [Candidatus Aminicenantes bacterium]
MTEMTKSNIPEKLTFRRKEVMQLAKLDGRVLDYWEKEFAFFTPVTNQSGEKFYSRRDVEIIMKIKEWLGRDKCDKNKIKEMLLQNFGEIDNVQNTSAPEPLDREKVKRIRRGLDEILTLLAKDDKN